MGGFNSLILCYHVINSLGFALHPSATAHIIINIYISLGRPTSLVSTYIHKIIEEKNR